MKHVVAAAVAVGLIGGASMASERPQHPHTDASYPRVQDSDDNKSGADSEIPRIRKTDTKEIAAGAAAKNREDY